MKPLKIIFSLLCLTSFLFGIDFYEVNKVIIKIDKIPLVTVEGTSTELKALEKEIGILMNKLEPEEFEYLKSKLPSIYKKNDKKILALKDEKLPEYMREATITLRNNIKKMNQNDIFKK